MKKVDTARMEYERALNEATYLGALESKAREEYTEVFFKYRQQSGKEAYGTAEGICKNAREKLRIAEENHREAINQKESAWKNYEEACRVCVTDLATDRKKQARLAEITELMASLSQWEELPDF